MRISDWSSDVCSSDLGAAELQIFNACQCVDAFVTAQGRHGNHAVAVTDRVVADCQAVDGSIIARPTIQRVVAATAGQGIGASIALEHIRIVVTRQPVTVSRANQTFDIGQHIRSEEHTSELQSLMRISYAVFCLKKKKITIKRK